MSTGFLILAQAAETTSGAADLLNGPLLYLLIGVGAVALVVLALGLRYIPNDQVGVLEKLWSTKGSVPEGSLIALSGEAGYQADLLRGGVHLFHWRWQYRIHKLPLVTVPQGKIAYVYARDGQPLGPSQTLARVVASNNFQSARDFLRVAEEDSFGGQRGRQRAILREGVYAINLALFVVITEDSVYRMNLQGKEELQKLIAWQEELRDEEGFDPIVIGREVETSNPVNPETRMTVDSIGIVTVHDGPSLPPGEIIAPPVAVNPADPNYHNNYQDPEAFLRAGGYRGRQYAPLTDGTYFVNRWFAKVEIIPKTIVPIGYVGVVVSYYGKIGADLSGTAFRHGERVAEGERGVWERALGPGKYAFNTYAGTISLVPTTNFVLHWITGRSESHHYDETLKSIDLVTRDAYEPLLPLSLVVHIDYQKASGVIQRFGDVQKLITQTLDPMLSAYFRDIAHKKTMLQILQERDSIQNESRQELQRKFAEFDIQCVDVLIGKPDTAQGGGKIEILLEQLRLRQLSIEQLETFDRQRAASEKLRVLNEAQAQAAKQTELTNSQVQIQIAENQGNADLAKARRHAEQTIVIADAELQRSRREAEQIVVIADAESRQSILAGRGEGMKTLQIGLSEASVLMRKIASYGDPRLYAMSLVVEHLAKSSQPLVPERLFLAGGTDGQTAGVAGAGQGLLGLLISMLLSEKSGFAMSETPEMASFKEFADRLSREAMESLQQGPKAPAEKETPKAK